MQLQPDSYWIFTILIVTLLCVPLLITNHFHVKYKDLALHILMSKARWVWKLDAIALTSAFYYLSIENFVMKSDVIITTIFVFIVMLGLGWNIIIAFGVKKLNNTNPKA